MPRQRCQLPRQDIGIHISLIDLSCQTQQSTDQQNGLFVFVSFIIADQEIKRQKRRKKSRNEPESLIAVTDLQEIVPDFYQKAVLMVLERLDVGKKDIQVAVKKPRLDKGPDLLAKEGLEILTVLITVTRTEEKDRQIERCEKGPQIAGAQFKV